METNLIIWWLFFCLLLTLSLILAFSGTHYFYQLQCSSCGERQHVFLRWRQQTKVHHYFQNEPFTFKATTDTRNTRHSFCFSSLLCQPPPPPPLQPQTPPTPESKRTLFSKSDLYIPFVPLDDSIPWAEREVHTWHSLVQRVLNIFTPWGKQPIVSHACCNECLQNMLYHFICSMQCLSVRRRVCQQ